MLSYDAESALFERTGARTAPCKATVGLAHMRIQSPDASGDHTQRILAQLAALVAVPGNLVPL